jgi:hypothetical protein
VTRRWTLSGPQEGALLGQATQFDWVIDPLSDWIDADTSPAHAAEVRAEKQRVHQAALGLYRGWSAG